MDERSVAVGLCLALAGCGHAQTDRLTTGAASAPEPRISLQEPSSITKGISECPARGEPRPGYVAALVAFVKSHMLRDHKRLGKTVLFAPSPSRPDLQLADVAMTNPPAGEVSLGLQSVSVDGRLVMFTTSWGGVYCVHVDEQTSPPSLSIDFISSAIID